MQLPGSKLSEWNNCTLQTPRAEGVNEVSCVCQPWCVHLFCTVQNRLCQPWCVNLYCTVQNRILHVQTAHCRPPDQREITRSAVMCQPWCVHLYCTVQNRSLHAMWQLWFVHLYYRTVQNRLLQVMWQPWHLYTCTVLFCTEPVITNAESTWLCQHFFPLLIKRNNLFQWLVVWRQCSSLVSLMTLIWLYKSYF